jgi:transcriptional regulator with XRE-family HTH domain
MNIGQRIKEKRKELKISADELGKRLGKDRSTIYRYEKGDIENLPLDILEPIAKALDTTPGYLMGWENIQQKNSVLADLTIRMRTDNEFFSIVEGLDKLDSVQLASVKQVVDAFLLMKG